MSSKYRALHGTTYDRTNNFAAGCAAALAPMDASELAAKLSALKAEAIELRAAGDKHGALAKVREMRAMQSLKNAERQIWLY